MGLFLQKEGPLSFMPTQVPTPLACNVLDFGFNTVFAACGWNIFTVPTSCQGLGEAGGAALFAAWGLGERGHSLLGMRPVPGMWQEQK